MTKALCTAKLQIVTNIKSNKNSPIIMGVINLTPDSFSDGGKYNSLEKAVKRAKELEKEGANIIDIGGESTGPGSRNISLKSELERVIPALKEIRKNTKLPISVDTYKSEVARQALEEGANIINDVTALRGDKKMAKILAKYQCPVILMYSKDKNPRTTVKAKKYSDVTKTVKNFLEKRVSFATQQGIKKKNIILDPGMGQFISSIPKYSYELIAHIPALKRLGHEVLIGISRKSFLGKGSLKERDHRSKIVETIAYLNGASIIRTHNVKELKLWLQCN